MAKAISTGGQFQIFTDAYKEINLPKDIGKDIHQNRLLKTAREGRQMTPQHLRDFEESRRYATLVAILLETKASIIDEIIEMNDKIIGSLFRYAKNTQAQKIQESGKSMGDSSVYFLKLEMHFLMPEKQEKILSMLLSRLFHGKLWLKVFRKPRA